MTRPPSTLSKVVHAIVALVVVLVIGLIGVGIALILVLRQSGGFHS